MTCVPVLGDEQFQFPLRVIFGDFCSNWFKLVTAKQPNSQPKKKVVVTLFKIGWLIGGFNKGCLAEVHTETAMCVKWWLQNLISES